MTRGGFGWGSASLLAVVLLAVGSVAAGVPAAADTTKSSDLPQLRQHALELVNKSRRANGLSSLELAAPLNKAAEFHADDSCFALALVVGTVLNAINQGDETLGGEAPNWFKLILTYLVPYAVAPVGRWPPRRLEAGSRRGDPGRRVVPPHAPPTRPSAAGDCASVCGAADRVLSLLDDLHAPEHAGEIGPRERRVRNLDNLRLAIPIDEEKPGLGDGRSVFLC